MAIRMLMIVKPIPINHWSDEKRFSIDSKRASIASKRAFLNLL